MKNILSVTFCSLIIALFVPVLAQKEQKMTAEDIVLRHLDSVGTKENREQVKNQVGIGTAQFTILRQGGLGANGNAIVFSEGEKAVFGLTFQNPNYPFEKIGYDGKKLKVAFVKDGSRSALGTFIHSNQNIFTEGTFGGVLSSSWSLARLAEKKAKVEFDGKKKIDGKEMYILSYSPKGGSDVSFKLYFDTGNFRHLRTEYRMTISAGQASSPDASSSRRETRKLLTEEFFDFRTANGLNLPHSYRLYLALDGNNGTNEYEWKCTFSQFYFNQKLEASSFDIDTN